MTDSTTNLTVRVTLTPAPPAPVKPPGSRYRWDRIVVAASILAVLGALAVKTLLPGQESPPTQPAPAAAHEARPIIITNAPIAEPAAEHPQIVDAAPDVEAEAEAEAEADNSASNLREIPIAKKTPVNQQTDPIADTAAPQPRPALASTQTRILSERVQRFMMTSAVNANEPVGDISQITQDENSKGLLKVFAYSQVQGLQGETLHYRWLHHDKVAASVKIGVRSSNWRSHTSKYLNQQMRGPWRVELLTAKGELLAFTEFNY